jgi:hypothetical protein
MSDSFDQQLLPKPASLDATAGASNLPSPNTNNSLRVGFDMPPRQQRVAGMRRIVAWWRAVTPEPDRTCGGCWPSALRVSPMAPAQA